MSTRYEAKNRARKKYEKNLVRKYGVKKGLYEITSMRNFKVPTSGYWSRTVVSPLRMKVYKVYKTETILIFFRTYRIIDNSIKKQR